MDSNADVFRVRLNCVDFYQATPSPLDPPLWGASNLSATQKHKLPQVPVIRVFGSTQTGQKVCAHVHGAFPYLYIPYTESLAKEKVSVYIETLRHSIDHALALSYRRNPYDNPRNATFVAHVSLVKGVPFFGYHVGYKHFLKIYLLNPMHMTRFADLLQQGAIMKRVFQPFEAHLQYLLQWMCDYNLFGCAYIDTNRPRFRGAVPQWEDLENPSHLWHSRTVASSLILDEDVFPKQSHCQLEVDICAEDILNRHAVEPRHLHHSLMERLTSLENLPSQEKFVHSMAGLWRDETLRRKRRMGITDPSSSPFPPEVLVSISADPRNDNEGGWIHESEFRDLIAELAIEERRARGDTDISMADLGTETNNNDEIQTVFDSVSDLFETALRDQLPIMQDAAGSATISEQETEASIVIDAITQVGDDHDYESDEEVARMKALTQLDNNTFGIARNETSTHSTKRQDCDGIQSSPKKFKTGKGDERSKRKQVSFGAKHAGSAKSIGDGCANKASNLLEPLNPKLEDIDVIPAHVAPTSSQQSPHPSQQKALDFPVIKNGPEPDSSLRVNQREEFLGLSHQNAEVIDKVTTSNSSRSVRDWEASLSKESLTLSDTASGRRRISDVLAANYARTLPTATSQNAVLFPFAAPSVEEVNKTISPSMIYQDAYFSDEKDVPERPREYAGQEFKLGSITIPFLPHFDRTGGNGEIKAVLPDQTKTRFAEERRRNACTIRSWEILQPPPTWNEVEQWAKAQDARDFDGLDLLDIDQPSPSTPEKRQNRPAPEMSQIEGPTQKNKHGFKFSQRKASTSVQHETGYMSMLSLEVHANSRGDLAPDPEKDAVSFVAWCFSDEQMDDDTKTGLLILSEDAEFTDAIRRLVGHDVQVDAEEDELDLINRVVDIVRMYDPDILTGFEVHNHSWGYLIERARLKYEFNLPDEFSRVKSQSHGRFGKEADRWGFTQTSTVRVTGRHTINIWRAMRSELNLLQYTMENVVFHLLHRRIPHYAFATLTRWYTSKKPRDLTKVLEYFLTRTKLDLEILDANELIPRTSEQARLLGVDFFSVFSRGSQFKVESLMFRIAKPESFLLVSPSRKQVGAQNALECIPLVMEPQSAFYSSPLLVLDFQSLYPSVMIAYNYCYSTCLGRVVGWRGTNKLGFADFQRTPGLLELVQDKINIAPNGMMYVRPEMRKSLLAKMLGEILETRVMVKSGMKVDKSDRTLQQLLNNRQLALKLIANVTYGYTSASFSGRMPCSEIADSIVQTGRETLEKAIALIHSVEKWGAEVVYGDTDSLFVYLKGRSRTEAFRIGDEIAQAVTDTNPRPVKLKFEKVYHPCVLLAKKRYVGYKYESPRQLEPEFDAKGIETVRRDGTPAEQKIEEKVLKLLFRTSDLSQVKRYFQAQCTKIMTGRCSVQDFCFAKEVKLGTYADKGPPPPGALIATRRMLRDPRTEPQYGERVPYVVITGAPGARLWERCVEPERLIYDENAELDAEYYISKNLIPPLERIFNLVGANVRQWYDEMPKVQRVRTLGGPREPEAMGKVGRKTMESYMGSSLCLVCRTKLPPLVPGMVGGQLPLCQSCQAEQRPRAMSALWHKVQKAESTARDLSRVCRDCANLAPGDDVACDSRDCPVFYSRVKADTKLRTVRFVVGGVLAALEQDEMERDALELEW